MTEGTATSTAARRPSIVTAFAPLSVVGGVAGVAAAAVPDAGTGPTVVLASTVLVTSGFGIAAGARRVGPTLARLQHRLLDPFVSFSLAAAALVVQAVLARTDAGGPDAVVGSSLLAGAGLLLAAAITGLLRERFRGHAMELAREAFFVATFAGVAAWLFWLEGPFLERPASRFALVAGLVAAWACGAALLLAIRLAFTVAGPIRWLVGPTLTLTAGAALSLVQQVEGPRSWTDAVLLGTALGTAGLLGAVLGLPRLGPLRTSVLVPPTRAGFLRLAVVFAAVLMVPAVTVMRLTDGGTVDIASLAVSTAVLSVAAVTYVGGLAQDWGNLERRASLDELTGLANRRSFTERVALVCAQAGAQVTTPAVLFCDLDRFKVVNDSLGHAAGNQLLVAVAGRIVDALPDDAVAARLGGDEFAILLPDATDIEAVAVARAVLGQLAEPISVRDRDVHVGASIGVARYPIDGTDPDTLLRAADTAMYRAKDLGRARVVLHNEALRTEAEHRFSLETDLHRAVDEGQLRLVYQPRVDLASGKVVGAEALVRWHHPMLGSISPSRFIPIAEETGLIKRVGLHTLRLACHQIARWEDEGFPDLVVSVNLSARQFELDRVADSVAQVLRETGADPRHLELELTESLAQHDVDQVSSTLAELAAMGVRCSVDDFGTGYSGLSYLGRFPLHALKIDKGFVQAIDSERAEGEVGEPESVVTAVIALSRSFGLRVIAEGVETLEQLRFLLDNGCDELQGHLFSPPLEVDAFESLLMLERVATGPGRLAVLRAALDADAATPPPATNVIHLGNRRLTAG